MPVTISVAMATFNGETFLAEQLDSIAQQTHLPLELVVRDDGSSDGTRSVLRRFAERAPFPVRLLPAGPRLGYPDNFLAVADACEGDYVSFCDQDDVWLPNKLQVVEAAITRGQSPAIVMHSATDVDERLHPLEVHLNHNRASTSRRLCADPMMVVRGLLLTARRDVFRLVPHDNRPYSTGPQSEHVAHDVWAYHCGNMLGSVIVLPDKLALYRRHEANVTLRDARRRPSSPLQRIRWVDRGYLERHARFFLQVADLAPDPLARDTYGLYAQILRTRLKLYQPGSSVAQRLAALGSLIAANARNHAGAVMRGRTILKDAVYSFLGPDRGVQRSGAAQTGTKKLAPLGEQDER